MPAVFYCACGYYPSIDFYHKYLAYEAVEAEGGQSPVSRKIHVLANIKGELIPIGQPRIWGQYIPVKNNFFASEASQPEENRKSTLNRMFCALM